MHHGRLSQPTAKGLEVLRQRIARAGVPSSCLDETLTIATWNIRELGRRRRKRASLHYIAEIIGQFFTHSFTGLGGVVDFYAGDHQALFPRCRMTKREFTYELSDHLPVWAQVRTDVRSERVDLGVGVAAE